YISCTVKNQGSGSAASSYINYYLSSNTTYDPVDTYFTSDYVSDLSSGGTSSESATVTIPSGTSTGTKYILFYADKDGAVSESDESNNVVYKAITVTEALPAPPTLSSPADGSTLPHGSNITFSWVNSSSSVSNSSIKVCTNTSMTTGCQFFETGLTQTIVSDLMFTPGVNYHWQARSKTSTSSWGIYGPTPAWSFTVDLPAPPTLNLTAETWTGSRSGVSEPTFPYDGDVALWLRVQNPGRTVNTYMTLTDPANGTRYCYYADNSLPTGDEEPPKILSFNSSKQAMFSSSWAVEEGDFLINRYVYSAANEPGVRTFTFWHEDSTTGERISEAEVSFSIQPLINPQVSVSPSFGPQGTTFQQPGTGFTPNGSVTLHFNGPDGSSTLAKTADSNGAYTSSWLCDACPAGTYTYYAVDNTTGQQSNTVTFTVTSQIFDTPFLTSFYRSYSTTDTDHFYTTNPVERDDAANNSGYTLRHCAFKP
ncbi:MAG: hypothetical protein JRE47_15585, partial [Deltaproteobacteria bacterium]|nr:hypothetical protein [Deltaproteobacteria bacterium]